MKNRSAPGNVMLPGLTVPEELNDRFRARAAEDQISLSEAMRRALQMFLSDPTAASLTPDQQLAVSDIARREMLEVLRDARQAERQEVPVTRPQELLPTG